MEKFILAGASLLLGLTVSFTAAAADKTLAEKHGGMFPKSVNGYVTKTQCLKCHQSYDALKAKTARLEPNPHYSHLGEVNCEDCHKANKAKPEIMCNQCHKFTLRVKEQAAKKM